MKNKKAQKVLIGIIIGIVLIAIIGGGFYYFSSTTLSGPIGNGYWNEATQECWISKNRPPGEPMPASELEDKMFASCCFNKVGNQVDCNNPSHILGTGTTQEVLTFGAGDPTPGIFSINHIITITVNTGSAPLDSAWISSAVWTPSHTELTNAYASIVGVGNAVGPLNPDQGTYWTTGTIDLSQIAGSSGSPILYTLDLNVDASAYSGDITTSKSFGTTMEVETEEIGFNVDISWAEI